MDALFEARRHNLNALIQKFGSVAELNTKTGRDRRAPTFSMLRNGTGGVAGKPRIMGSAIARELEEKLGLEPYWMDTFHEDDHVDFFERTPEILSDGIAIKLIPLQGGQLMKKTTMYIEGHLFKEEFQDRSADEFRGAVVATDSMSPTYIQGDRMLVDITVHQFTSDGVYVLKIGDNNILRTLTLKMDGKHRVSAENRPNDDCDLEDTKAEIVGRCVYAWRGKKI